MLRRAGQNHPSSAHAEPEGKGDVREDGVQTRSPLVRPYYYLPAAWG